MAKKTRSAKAVKSKKSARDGSALGQKLPFNGKILMVGCGSIGQAILPLIFKHLNIKPSQLSIIEADSRGAKEAKRYGVKHEVRPLTRDNYVREIKRRVRAGDFLLNLSVDTSSADIMELCHKLRVLYLDTVAEPWTGFYTNPRFSAEERSNYALRERILALRRKYKEGPTAVSCMGANPGLVSSFVKQALLNIARDTGVSAKGGSASGGKAAKPQSREEWARLAQKLSIKVIHVAERDTQVSPKPKEVGEFVNTWSIDGFVSEGGQPSEMGWGSHEKQLPPDGKRHTFGCMAAIYLNRPGLSTRVRSWTPGEGPFHGFIITHNESISTSDYFSVKKHGKVIYRPTCHYAYHPCDAAVLSLHEMAGKNGIQQKRQRLIVDEITEGVDELGVLLMGHKKKSYWYGSFLSIQETRRLVPYNNATSLQVAIAALAGILYVMENPSLGIIEAEDLDHDYVLKISKPYLGKMVGKYSNWTPLQDRGKLFPEDLDTSDPWQFKNFRVN